MAKKKPQHLYELLGKKAHELEAPPAKPAAQPEGGQAPPARPIRQRPVYTPRVPMSAPVPAGTGQERVLENVITMRRDTAIVAILLIVVAVVAAFMLGWYAAPKYIEEKVPTPEFQGAAPETHTEPGEPESPPTDREQEEAREAAEEARRIAEEAAGQPVPAAAPEPEGKWYVQLGSYGESDKHVGEDVAKYLKEKKGYNAEVAKSGRAYMLRVIGYKTRADAERVKVELADVEYRGTRYWPVDKTMVKKKD